MNVSGYDFEPERIVVRIERPSGSALGPCDMIRDEAGNCFLVLDWIRTHDGDVPATRIPLEARLLEPCQFQHFPGECCQFSYKGLVRLSADNTPL